MPLRTTDRDFAAICLVPPGNVAREIAALKRRLFAATGEARALAVPETAILVAAPWDPVLGGREGRRGIRAAFESAWRCMEGKFGVKEVAIASGWLVLPLEDLPSAMLQRLSSSVEAGNTSRVSPFPDLPSFPLCPIRDEAKTLAEAAKAAPLKLAFGDAGLALLRFRLSEGSDGMEALSWSGIAAVRRRTGPRMTDSL